jgi:hypothetical protein
MGEIGGFIAEGRTADEIGTYGDSVKRALLAHSTYKTWEEYVAADPQGRTGDDILRSEYQKQLNRSTPTGIAMSQMAIDYAEFLDTAEEKQIVEDVLPGIVGQVLSYDADSGLYTIDPDNTLLPWNNPKYEHVFRADVPQGVKTLRQTYVDSHPDNTMDFDTWNDAREAYYEDNPQGTVEGFEDYLATTAKPATSWTTPDRENASIGDVAFTSGGRSIYEDSLGNYVFFDSGGVPREYTYAQYKTDTPVPSNDQIRAFAQSGDEQALADGWERLRSGDSSVLAGLSAGSSLYDYCISKMKSMSGTIAKRAALVQSAQKGDWWNISGKPYVVEAIQMVNGKPLIVILRGLDGETKTIHKDRSAI